ncbi:MAG TPA: EVE domain-containing protein [Bacteroidales bacterium]|nr:EVE domain-containing protein [Bacteroidales bacterium]
MNYWLLKSEPETYPWETLVKEGVAVWDGVRNYQARNNLRLMKFGDLALFYHSGNQKQVVGICKVSKEHYPEPGQETAKWVVVEVSPIKPLQKPATLGAMKAEPKLGNLAMLRHTRLSVVPVSQEEFNTIVELGNSSKL